MGHQNSNPGPMKNSIDPAASAAHKMATGVLMRLAEVGAVLDLAPATVHGLPLQSVRIGRSLRFDPIDVRRFIESCKEATVSVEVQHGR
ncbi:MAG: hypothetical protein JWL97_4324 [Gemmatimonadales bacterium]|nr:hypothetical protein [Gemmatimonadales bacterium]